MRLPIVFLAVIVFVSVLAASAQEVIAGAQDTGALASCEIARAQGIRIEGTAAVSIDLLTNLAAASFQTRAHKPHWSRKHDDDRDEASFVVIRVLVGLDLGTSPMENVCQILNGETAEGPTEPTLAQQILAAVGLKNREIKITKRGIFGCDVLPCEDPGRRPDFALIPGSDALGNPITSALGTVRLFAVSP